MNSTKTHGASCAGRLAVLAVVMLCASAWADSALTTQRTVTQLQDGIFVIRHPDAPDTYPQGNSTVIVGDRDVLVIDSGYLPSSAAEDIAQIRQWTAKPVRYLVNTHWHPDHQRGNFTYAQAFPDLAIVAHPQTVRLMETYEAGNLERYPRRVEALRTALEQGRDAAGKRLTQKSKKEMRDTLAQRAPVLAEMQKSHMVLPNLTFDHELNIDLGNRLVQLRHSGRGDTQGDVWAYLPQEKILVTGDVLTAPVPYFFAGYPEGLANTLRQLLELDAGTIVPGHGAVMHDKAYMHAVLDTVDSVMAQVNAAIVKLGSLSAQLEDVRKQVDIAGFRQQFVGEEAGNREYFDESIEGLIKDAFYQAPK